MPVYSLLEWKVKPERETDFIAKWREVAAANKAQYGTQGWARLLQDEQDPTRFVSLTQWPESYTFTGWGSSEGFTERTDRTLELADAVIMRTLRQAAEV